MSLEDFYKTNWEKHLEFLTSDKPLNVRKNYLKQICLQFFISDSKKAVNQDIDKSTRAKVARAQPDNFLNSDINQAIASSKVKQYKMMEKLRLPEEDLTKSLVGLFKEAGVDDYTFGLIKGIELGQDPEALKALNLK